MKYLQTDARRGWRRPTGWIACYLLVLQLLVGSFAGAQFSAQAAEQNWSFFEICYGAGAPDGEHPQGQPAKQASKCAACVLAASPLAALAPEAAEIAAPAYVVVETNWVSREENLARFDTSFSQRQRAPPKAA